MDVMSLEGLVKGMVDMAVSERMGSRIAVPVKKVGARPVSTVVCDGGV
jgi:hypothetical protein